MLVFAYTAGVNIASYNADDGSFHMYCPTVLGHDIPVHSQLLTSLTHAGNPYVRITSWKNSMGTTLGDYNPWARAKHSLKSTMGECQWCQGFHYMIKLVTLMKLRENLQ